MTNTLDEEWLLFKRKNGDGITNTTETWIPDTVAPPPSHSMDYDLNISTKTKVLFLNQTIDIGDVFWRLDVVPYWRPEAGVIKKQMKIVSKTPEEFLAYQARLATVPHYTETVLKQVNTQVLEGSPESVREREQALRGGSTTRSKFKDERKISIGITKKDLVAHRVKAKNAFYNCFVAIVRVLYLDVFKEIHVKVFNTGKMEIPGVVNNEILEEVKDTVLGILRPIIGDGLRFEENAETDHVLINSNFNCGFYLNRERLHTILVNTYGIESAYDPCSYPGVKCKFYFNHAAGFDQERQTGKILAEDQNLKLSELDGNCQYTEVSFMIFRTGSCLIVGNCSEKILRFIFAFIKRILYNEYDQIHVLNEPLLVKNKKPKPKKRTLRRHEDASV